MILILAAMPQELNAIKAYIEVDEELTVLDKTAYKGSLAGQEVLLALTGIGKVSTAMTLTSILSSTWVDAILNLGSAGGLGSHQAIGDVVIAEKGSFHDRFFSDQPDLSSANLFSCDTELMKRMDSVLNSVHINHHKGLMVSGDQFLTQLTPHYETLGTYFPDAISVDMESTTVMQVAQEFKVPCLVIRSLSDVPSASDHEGQFDHYLEFAAKQSALMCLEFMKSYQNKTL